MVKKTTNKKVNKKTKSVKTAVKRKKPAAAKKPTKVAVPKKRYLKRHEVYDEKFHDLLKSSVVASVLNACQDLTGQQRTLLNEFATELGKNEHLTVSKARRAIRNASRPKKPRKPTPWMLFVSEKRKSAGSVRSQSDFIKKIAQEWKTLNKKQKSKYGVQVA